MNYISSSGLFDFNLTLVFIIFQFLLLMLILNSILYKPLLSIIDYRNTYINKTLKKINNINYYTNQLNIKYETELKYIQQQSQFNIEEMKEIYKKLFQFELNHAEKNINQLFKFLINNIIKKKNNTFKKLDLIVQILTRKIENKLILY